MDNNIKDSANWAFWGAGGVITNKAIPAFLQTKHSKMHGVARREETLAKNISETFSIPNYYSSYDELLKDEKVDIVYISTPPGLHLEHALRCADANKAVYLEKPFARNYSEAKQLTEYFQKKNVPLCIAHYRRSHPKFTEIKGLVESQRLGHPLTVQSYINRQFDDRANQSWMHEIKLSGGGKYFDIAPHTIDLIVFLFGNFQSIAGCAKKSSKTQTEESVATSFQMESGVMGNVLFSTNTAFKSDETIITFEKGSITYQSHGNIDRFLVTEGNKTKEMLVANCPPLQTPMLDDYSKHIMGLSKNPCSGQQAQETYRFIDIALFDIYGDRQTEFWNRS